MIGPKIRRARAPPIAAIAVRLKSSAMVTLTAAAPSRPKLARHPRSRPRTGWDHSARGNCDTGLTRCLAVKATAPKPSKPTNAGTGLAMTLLQAARTASMPTTRATIRPRARPIDMSWRARWSDGRWRHTKAIPVRIAAAPVAEQVEDKEDRDPEDPAWLNRPVGRDEDEHEGGPG